MDQDPTDMMDRLMRAEQGLTRSFVAVALAFGASLLRLFFVGAEGANVLANPTPAAIALWVAQLAAYVWYALAAGAAAKVLGDAGWKYVAWILLAPLLAQLPIPIVSTLIAVSPLSIKFLLGGQLQTAMREAATVRG